MNSKILKIIYSLTTLFSLHVHLPPDPLKVAKLLYKERFRNYTYGDNIEQKKINCVTFMDFVVEALIGRRLADQELKMLNIIYEFNSLDSAVANQDERTRGLQKLLVDSLCVAQTVKVSNCQAGDLIQYWYRASDGHWLGHSGIISRVWKDSVGNVRCSLFGAHKSSNGIADSAFGGGLNLSKGKIVYICRMIH
jgi:hypothetical protein